MTTFTRPVEQYSVSCPNNDDGKIVKVGFHAGKQRYLCKTCGKKFREPDVYQEGRRYPIRQVADVLQGYFDGQSYREAARSLARTFETTEPDEAAVYEWVQGYARGAHEATKEIKIPAGEEWVADELFVKLGGKRYCLWNLMHRDNRFILATHLTPKRDARAASILLRKAKEKANGSPQFIRTDGLGSYGPAIKELFPRTKHIVSKGMDDPETHNNRSERLQGTIRDRDKVLRGMQTRESGQNYLDGWAVDYNYFRPHFSLDGRTPAAEAGIEVPFKNWNEVAEKVRPINTPLRPGWQTQDEKPAPSKEFQVVPLDVAREATRPMRPKSFKSAFKTWRGFLRSPPNVRSER